MKVISSPADSSAKIARVAMGGNHSSNRVGSTVADSVVLCVLWSASAMGVTLWRVRFVASVIWRNSRMRPNFTANHGPALRRSPGQRPGNFRLPWRQRLAGDPTTIAPTSADPLARRGAGPVGSSAVGGRRTAGGAQLATVAELPDTATVRRLVQQLQALYDQDGTAFQVVELAGGFQLLTRPEFHRWLGRLRQRGQEQRLSGAARETLAIIAYRQPITRADVEAIRGVHCGEILRLLMERGLLRITGRDDSLGLAGAVRHDEEIFADVWVEEFAGLAEGGVRHRSHYVPNNAATVVSGRNRCSS